MNVEFYFYNQQLLSNLKETPAQYKFYSAMSLVWKVPKQFGTALVPLKICGKGPMGDRGRSEINSDP